MRYHDTPMLWKDLLKQGLKDDGWPWDWTTAGIGAPSARGVRAQVVAKSDGVWAASGLALAAAALASKMGGKLQIKNKLKDGQKYKTGAVVCEWRGTAREVLALERPYLNLASYAGGVATATRELVDLVQNACPLRPPRVTATRKTLPGYRDLAIQGVLAGGGFSHRVSLSGGVLLKENHIAAAGGMAKAIAGCRASAPHILKIEVEVRSESELKQALKAGAEVVMLDNFSPAQVWSALGIIERGVREKMCARPQVEVSGGLNAVSIADYAIEGVDVLSVGSLSHSVKSVDLSLLIR